MTQSQILVALYIATVLARFPRINERWNSPFLRGPEWFFYLAVPAGFREGPGGAIVRRYRWRLFLPWALEIPLLSAALLAGGGAYVAAVLFGIILFTRFNYYAARLAAEKRARPFAVTAPSESRPAIAVSLQPRTLLAYTNEWIEATIAILLIATFALIAYGQPARIVLTVVILHLYLQAGLLLLKRGIIQSGGAAPAEDAAQYLIWRDSLRRFATRMCDGLRLATVYFPLIFTIVAILHLTPIQSQTVLIAALAPYVVIGGWYELRSRREYFECARQTKPARLFGFAAAIENVGLICFRPALPSVLLPRPSGYALNLASVPVRIAGAYAVGFAGLWALLMR